MNLPRSERFKKENLLLVGIISLGHEPASFMRPLVEVSGYRLNTAESPKYKLLFKLALMCVACDIPAARKCCSFKGHLANYGCSRCKKFFPGGFGERKDYSGFGTSQWQPRTHDAHMEAVKKV